MLRELTKRMRYGSGTASQDPVIRQKLAQRTIEVPRNIVSERASGLPRR